MEKSSKCKDFEAGISLIVNEEHQGNEAKEQVGAEARAVGGAQKCVVVVHETGFGSYPKSYFILK